MRRGRKFGRGRAQRLEIRRLREPQINRHRTRRLGVTKRRPLPPPEDLTLSIRRQPWCIEMIPMD